MEKEENIKKILQVLDKMKAEGKNVDLINEIKELLETGDLKNAIEKLKILQNSSNDEKDKDEYENNVEDEDEEEKIDAGMFSHIKLADLNEDKDDLEENYEDDIDTEKKTKKDDKETEIIIDDSDCAYPELLRDIELEKIYLGLLLNNPKAISTYYFLYEDCLFSNNKLLDIYKNIIFTEGANYASEAAKMYFNFSRVTKETNKLKLDLRTLAKSKKYDINQIYMELKKLFFLRKEYTKNPVREVQEKIAEIKNYALYSKMTITEVESAINQVTVTGKFKKSILNKDVTDFLLAGDNVLTTGIPLPFPILTKVFKGMRKGETMAFSMPSNAGKSRFTTNLACHVAFIEKKKVLIISNEMSEEKMKICLITTILNNPILQKEHGQVLSKTEGELLEFKFRPDDKEKVETDEEGFIIQQQGETRKQFIERLSKVSSEFKKTIEVTNWVNNEINNSIYFINITDHTNDELKKVITNYYYKEKIEYMFYDTMKTDTDNIGNSEEIKKTATILSNLAQNLNIFIEYTLQLAETQTLPINLTINDLSVSRTVKEVLDTLCLIKQIPNKTLKDYEYSLNEVDTKFYPLKEYKDPDERYYACIVDKNRAGSKPKTLFSLNLAYNRWTELGYLKLKDYNE